MRDGTAGLVLAGGAGRRWSDVPADADGSVAAGPAGTRPPKVLLTDGEGTSLLAHAVRTLVAGGCDPVVVVVGAHDDRVRRELAAIVDRGIEAEVQVVGCATWERGMGESLRTGLDALPALLLERPDLDVSGVVVTLADLPDQSPKLVTRLFHADPRGSGALARLVYRGRPGHPVLLGRDHWADAAAAAHDDVGARDLLASGQTVCVEGSDCSSGADVDRAADLPAVPQRWGAATEVTLT